MAPKTRLTAGLPQGLKPQNVVKSQSTAGCQVNGCKSQQTVHVLDQTFLKYNRFDVELCWVVFSLQLPGKEVTDDEMYGFQSLKNSIPTENLEAETLAVDEDAESNPQEHSMDAFSKMYEFFSSLWIGSDRPKKATRPHDCHREILSCQTNIDTAVRVEHFGDVVKAEPSGASFKPLNFCGQPTNAYITSATCRKCLGQNEGDLPSSFLAILHRLPSPVEKEELVKKQSNRGSGGSQAQSDLTGISQVRFRCVCGL